MKNPLISVLVTTRNNYETLDACLKSIAKQTYNPIELIVVDNNSSDDTKNIARKYTTLVFNKGPERSAQRNFAVHKATGKYITIIDSDMELSPGVISDCVQTVKNHSGIQALIIPEESFGKGFWAQCKQLERTFYVGVDWMEAARFYNKQLYIRLGGYNEHLISGEDWDLSQRAAEKTKLGRIEAYIYHNEGKLKLSHTLKKKYYYAQNFAKYIHSNQHAAAVKSQTGPLARYKLFFNHPIRLLRNPFVGIGMLYMKTCEFSFGALGYFTAKGTQRNVEEVTQ